jgi:L,D-peptidoglycan transpeptidase YkuD (ErfK/YbiS/YcfS/YnhG family)
VKIKYFFKNILTAITGCGILLMLSFVPLSFADISEVSPLNKIINESSQILLVTNDYPSSITVKVSALEKKQGKWKRTRNDFNGVIGRNGFAKPGEKREGDGRTPSGIFSLQRVFGYAATAKTKMPYRQVLADDLWIDDVSAPDYNLWVKKKDTSASSYENMRRDDDLYKYGIVIEYNTSPVIKGWGSAIFLHIRSGQEKPTAGCVAITEDDIVKVLGWLDPKAKPLIIMGTQYKIERFLQ